MSGHSILHVALRNARSADEQRDTDILLKAAGLPWWQTMLTDVEAIVGGVNDIGVVQLVALLETGYQQVYKLVYALQSTQARAIEEVIVVDHRLILLRQVADPTDSTGLGLLVGKAVDEEIYT